MDVVQLTEKLSLAISQIFREKATLIPKETIADTIRIRDKTISFVEEVEYEEVIRLPHCNKEGCECRYSLSGEGDRVDYVTRTRKENRSVKIDFEILRQLAKDELHRREQFQQTLN